MTVPTDKVDVERASWHCRQAAAYYDDSTLHFKSAQCRGINRNRFIRETKAGLPALGLDRFLELFNAYYRGQFGEVAEAIIRETWAELSNPKPANGKDTEKAYRLGFVQGAAAVIDGLNRGNVPPMPAVEVRAAQ